MKLGDVLPTKNRQDFP